jgi:hypothetical protein
MVALKYGKTLKTHGNLPFYTFYSVLNDLVSMQNLHFAMQPNFLERLLRQSIA